MSGKFDMGNYVEVDERIREFKELYPEGRLQSEPFVLPEFPNFVCVKAFAFRDPDDLRPGIGLAWEPVPGKTPYTKDSELQNAETSAWGRALVAALVADTKRGIASANEVRNRVSASGPGGPKRKGGGDPSGAADRRPPTNASPPGADPISATKSGNPLTSDPGGESSVLVGEGEPESGGKGGGPRGPSPTVVTAQQKQRAREYAGSLPAFIQNYLPQGKSLTDYDEPTFEEILKEVVGK